MTRAAYRSVDAGESRSLSLSFAAVWPGARAVALPLSLVALALLLRTWRLDLQGWTPDTYEQLDAAKRLLAGELPLSRLYPPGIAITMAPFIVLLPATIATMQVVIVASSLVLVAVAYSFVLRATRDRLTAAMLAGAVAVAPEFVYFSRDALFDLVGTAWIITAIALVPALRKRGLWPFVAYGVMLSIAVNIRATNAAFLPALLIYWCGAEGVPLRPRALIACLSRRQLVLAGVVMVALSALYAYVGGWTGNAAGAPVTFGVIGKHVAFYVFAEFGFAGSAVVAPLAALGARELWRRDRPLLLVAIYMLAIWPLVHAPLPFANGRYMLAPLLLSLMLAAHAPAAVARMTIGWSPRTGRAVRGLCFGAIGVLGLAWLVSDGIMIYGWPGIAAQSDEAAYRALRPVVAQLPEGSLIVSSGARGVRNSSARVDYLDLIDYSLPEGNTPARVQGILDQIDHALGQGRPVYYLYTRLEGHGYNMGNGGPGYDRYYDGVTGRFGLTESYRTAVKYFVLYRVDCPHASLPARPCGRER